MLNLISALSGYKIRQSSQEEFSEAEGQSIEDFIEQSSQPEISSGHYQNHRCLVEYIHRKFSKEGGAIQDDFTEEVDRKGKEDSGVEEKTIRRC